jgi:hypothetical protein
MQDQQRTLLYSSGGHLQCPPCFMDARKLKHNQRRQKWKQGTKNTAIYRAILRYLRLDRPPQLFTSNFRWGAAAPQQIFSPPACDQPVNSLATLCLGNFSSGSVAVTMLPLRSFPPTFLQRGPRGESGSSSANADKTPK